MKRIIEKFEGGYKWAWTYNDEDGAGVCNIWHDSRGRVCDPPTKRNELKTDRPWRIKNTVCRLCSIRSTCLIDDNISSECYTGAGYNALKTDQQISMNWLPSSIVLKHDPPLP